MESHKTEERLVCPRHTEQSVGHRCHSPNNLSGSPAAQTPESCENVVNTLTNSIHCHQYFHEPPSTSFISLLPNQYKKTVCLSKRQRIPVVAVPSVQVWKVSCPCETRTGWGSPALHWLPAPIHKAACAVERHRLQMETFVWILISI